MQSSATAPIRRTFPIRVTSGQTALRLKMALAVATSSLAVVAFPAVAVDGEVTLASTTAGGTKGDGGSFTPSVSADGTRVAFTSFASNLVAGDSDAVDDLYVKDLVTGELQLASTAEDGTKGNDHSDQASLSADGTRVAFMSNASNLDAGDTDTTADVYVKDLVTGELLLASTTADGTKGNGGSSTPSLSADGTKVAFASVASNLEAADTDGYYDVYVKDLVSGELSLASTSDDGTKGNGGSYVPSVSEDGTRVAFGSAASNLGEGDTDSVDDVYVKDLGTGELNLASTSDSGSTKGNGLSDQPSLSADGTQVAFNSVASNLDAADTDNVWDVYVKDLVSGGLSLASTSDGGTKGNGASSRPSLSADGTSVAFGSVASNFGEGAADTAGDVYVKDLNTGELSLASAAADGTNSDETSVESSLTGDGTQVAFDTTATNLSADDTDTFYDVYVKTLGVEPPVSPAPTCAGRSATIYVSDGQIIGGPDTGEPYDRDLPGTNGPDVIVGTATTDRVLAGGGKDRVCTLGGNDTAIGGPDGDRLFGGGNRDDLSGGNGRDTVNGGGGSDTLAGGSQADKFIGGTGTDTATDYKRAEGDTINNVP